MIFSTSLQNGNRPYSKKGLPMNHIYALFHILAIPVVVGCALLALIISKLCLYLATISRWLLVDLIVKPFEESGFALLMELKKDVSKEGN